MIEEPEPTEAIKTHSLMMVVFVSYGIIFVHAIWLLAAYQLGAKLPRDVAGVACILSSVVVVVKINREVESIPSRIKQSLASVMVLPPWFLLFIFEILFMVEAMGF